MTSLIDGGSKRIPDHIKNIPVLRMSALLVICENFHASVWYDNCNFLSHLISLILRDMDLPRFKSDERVAPAERIILPSLRLIVTSWDDALLISNFGLSIKEVLNTVLSSDIPVASVHTLRAMYDCMPTGNRVVSSRCPVNNHWEETESMTSFGVLVTNVVL